MSAIQRFEDIRAWQKARELVREVDALCAAGPISKDFGLRDQLCRAAVSVMSNIAEGFGRSGDREFGRFLDIARGSAAEVQSLLYVALDTARITETDFDRLMALARQTAGLITNFSAYLKRPVE